MAPVPQTQVLNGKDVVHSPLPLFQFVFKGEAVPVALAAFCRFLHAVVAEFRRVFQGLRHAFTVHQLAAQGGDEHITRAMQRLRKAGA